MKKATGAVVKIYNNYVCVRTVHGDFINLKIKNYTPNVGDIYTGPIYQGKSLNIVLAIVFCLFLSIIFLGKNIYHYFTPTATIIVSIPPSISLKVNKWNKIIDASGINSSGKELYNFIDVKNKPLNEGLQIIIKEAKAQKKITSKHTDEKNPITVYISSKSNKKIDLIKFDNFMEHQELTYQVNINGKKY